MPSPTILIIDDDAAIRQSFADYLEDAGYQTLIAENGRIGLEMMRREQPDLMLTDLRMPEMGGLEVIQHGSQIAPDMPIIVVSGAGRIGDAIQALRLGAWDYILKPIEEMSILEYRVGKAFEKARLIQENRMYQENLETLVRERTTELKHAKERTEHILNSIQSGVFVIDAITHTIIEANPAAAEMIHATQDEMIGKVCHNYICPAEQGQCPITDKGQKIDNAECLLITKTGESKSIFKTVVPATLEGRECLLESFIDITERVQAEEERERLIGELQDDQLGNPNRIAPDYQHRLLWVAGFRKNIISVVDFTDPQHPRFIKSFTHELFNCVQTIAYYKGHLFVGSRDTNSTVIFRVEIYE